MREERIVCRCSRTSGFFLRRECTMPALKPCLSLDPGFSSQSPGWQAAAVYKSASSCQEGKVLSVMGWSVHGCKGACMARYPAAAMRHVSSGCTPSSAWSVHSLPQRSERLQTGALAAFHSPRIVRPLSVAGIRWSTPFPHLIIMRLPSVVQVPSAVDDVIFPSAELVTLLLPPPLE